MTKVHQYKAGTALALSEGDYSSYGYISHVVTTKDCDIPSLMEAFKAQYVPKDEWDKPDPDKFVAWLVVNEHVFPASVQEVHLGSYGELQL